VNRRCSSNPTSLSSAVRVRTSDFSPCDVFRVDATVNSEANPSFVVLHRALYALSIRSQYLDPIPNLPVHETDTHIAIMPPNYPQDPFNPPSSYAPPPGAAIPGQGTQGAGQYYDPVNAPGATGAMAGGGGMGVGGEGEMTERYEGGGMGRETWASESGWSDYGAFCVCLFFGRFISRSLSEVDG
jgi:hypothetical protein